MNWAIDHEVRGRGDEINLRKKAFRKKKKEKLKSLKAVLKLCLITQNQDLIFNKDQLRRQISAWSPKKERKEKIQIYSIKMCMWINDIYKGDF